MQYNLVCEGEIWKDDDGRYLYVDAVVDDMVYYGYLYKNGSFEERPELISPLPQKEFSMRYEKSDMS